MHPACPNKKQNHLQNCLLRRTQFWVRKTFSKPASLKRASLVVGGKIAPVTSADRHTRKQHSNENRCRIHQVNQNDQWKGKVRVHLSRLWTDTQVQKQFKREAQKLNKKGGERVRVHLSRLRTDTQVQKK